MWTSRVCDNDSVFAQNVTALHIASMYANSDAVQVLLSCAGGFHVAQQAYSAGRLALHWAAMGPDGGGYMLDVGDVVPRLTATVKLLVRSDDRALTCNARDRTGKTPLHNAVRRHLEPNALVRFLCSHGADAGITGHEGEKPLHGLGRRIVGQR